MNVLKGSLVGAAAGAAGTTALNAVTYLDMTARARPSSSTPQDTVEAVVDKTGVKIHGDAAQRANRVAGLGALTGIVTGVAVGAVLGLARASGWRPGAVVVGVSATLGALVAGNVPMAALRVSDPRTWTATDWIADIVPHLAFGAVTAAVLRGLDAR